MRQPLRAIVRWAAIEVLVVQTLGAWLSRQIARPILLTWAASWAVYTLAGREGSRQGRFRYALVAGGAVAMVAHAFSTARLALKGLHPSGLVSPVEGVVWLLAAALWGAGWGLLGGLIGRLHQRRALLAFLTGLAPVLLAMMQLRSSNAFTRFVLWPVILLAGLLPRHNTGTSTNPFYEGTPVDMAAVTIGLVLCAILYSGIAYALLAWIQRGRAQRADLDGVGA